MEDYSQILQTLLKKRGLTKKQDIDAFLNPSYDNDLHDPFLMLGMNKAVIRILQAFEKDQKIAIYSDFDADGIPAGAILYSFFKKIGYENFVNYIPHRDLEGYGLHIEAVEKLAKDEVGLIITVDVGITSFDAVRFANDLGVEIIITDHHETIKETEKEVLPDAYSILNPKQRMCKYPFKGLCGAGVAYKLVQATLYKMREDSVHIKTVESIPHGWEKWLLDLVAISTVADMVPLVGENRALVYWGLEVLHKSPRVGIMALCNKLRVNQYLLDENDIGFSIGPRINASSRMGHPEDAFKLLTAESVEEAEVLASKLESLNNKRKGRVAAIVRSAKTKVKLMEDALLNNGSNLPEVIVTGDPEWSPALVGLAAGSLADAFGKVVCIWGREGTGTLKGSCRNGGTDNSVVKIFENAGDALLFYGGHDAAGGFAVSDEKVHTIANVLNTALQSCDSSYNSGDECALDIKKQLYDIKLTLGNVNNLILRDLRKLAPFGISNPKPILLFERVTIQIIRHFGKEQNHLEVYVKGVDGASRKASKFFATAHSFGKEIVEGRVIDLYANMEESSFAGRRTLELRIVDIV